MTFQTAVKVIKSAYNPRFSANYIKTHTKEEVIFKAKILNTFPPTQYHIG